MRARGWRLVLGCAVVAAQAGWIAFAQTQPWRWFAWAPNDYVTRYSVETVVDGRTLTGAELCDRYGREFCAPEDDEAEDEGPPRYVDEGPAEHILSEIRSYEANHGNGEAQVTVRYRSTSFEGERVWRWPSR